MISTLSRYTLLSVALTSDLGQALPCVELKAHRIHVQMFPVHRVVTEEMLCHFQNLLNVAYSGKCDRKEF